MKETTQTNLPTFPVELYGHSLKYEIECMLKLFLPATKFVFSYETASLLRSAGCIFAAETGKTVHMVFLHAAVSGKIPPLCSKAAKVQAGRKQTDL